LRVEVADVQGNCPLYERDDWFYIEGGFALVTPRRLCMHALLAIAPYYVALSRGIPPADLGLGGPDGAAYVQCLDPQGYTGGGTVVFRVSRVEGSEPCPK